MVLAAVILMGPGCGDGSGPDEGTCSNPRPLDAGGRITGSTSSGPSHHDGMCMYDGGPEVVFLLDLVADARVEFSTVGSSFDSVLYVRRGSCTGTELGCDHDGAGGLDAYLDLTLEAGIYYVFVDGFTMDHHGLYVLDVHITMI